jgi:hypothetical protein
MLVTQMNAQQEAGAIIAHYLHQLTQASGRRWTVQNDHDMQRLAALLAGDQTEAIAPYYQPAPTIAAPPERVASVEERLKQLDDLRNRGIITDQEFIAKRAQILARL